MNASLQTPAHHVWFKIAAVYCFAIATSVACGKFEAGKTAITNGATTKGAAAVAAPGTPTQTQAQAEAGVKITGVRTEFIGDYEDKENYGRYNWKLHASVTDGSKQLTFVMNPTVVPLIADSAFLTDGTTQYVMQGICGNVQCSKFAVLINITDSTKQIDHQITQYWEGAALKRVFTGSDYQNVTQFYNSFSGDSAIAPTTDYGGYL